MPIQRSRTGAAEVMTASGTFEVIDFDPRILSQSHWCWPLEEQVCLVRSNGDHFEYWSMSGPRHLGFSE